MKSSPKTSFYMEEVEPGESEKITPEMLENAALQIERNIEENEKTKMSLRELLKKVSLKPPADYVPSLFALQFVNFIKLVNGEEGEENETPLLHYYLLDGFGSDHDRIAIMVFRGAAKTTLFEYLIFYLAIFQELPGLGALNSLLYMSDTIDNGVSNMQKNLAHRWKKSDFLQAQLPKAKLFKVSWEFENSAGEPFVVKGYGAASGFRGSKIMNKRPKLALLDDLISDAMSESDTEMRKVENVIKRGIQPALNPRQQRIIWAGTPFNERDPLCKAVVSGAWLTFMFPVCEQFPCTRKEFVGAWEDRFTFDHVKRQYDIAVAGGDTTEFYRELMLETTSDADKLIDTDKEIQWYPPEIVDFYHGEKTYIITSDLSFAGTSTSDDVIMDVWELRPNEDIYWVDGIHDQIGIDVTIDILFALVEQYRVISVGIEISGQQIAMIKLLEREMLKKNIFFELANERGRSKEQKGIRPVTNKLIRFKTVVPLFKRRKIFFPLRRKGDELMSAKVHQLDSVTRNGIRSRKDDALDSISMLGLMEINYPGERPETNSHKPQELDPHIWGKNILEAEDDYLDTYLV